MFYRGIVTAILLAVCLANTQENDVNQASQDPRVLIEVYAESLCPYCHKYITGPLAKALQTPNIWRIAKFRLIPYGHCKAIKQGKKFAFSCQHDEPECQGNIIMTCAFELYDDQTKAWPFVLCLQNSNKEWNSDGEKCARRLGMSWKDIKQCTNSYFGQERQFLLGLQTKSYIGVKSVPYVLGNGKEDASGMIDDDPLAYICYTYKGQQTIPACLKYLRT